MQIAGTYSWEIQAFASAIRHQAQDMAALEQEGPEEFTAAVRRQGW